MALGYIALHLDNLKLAIGADMIELRNPVIALVQDFVTGCCTGIGSCICTHRSLEGCPSRDSMDMARSYLRDREQLTLPVKGNAYYPRTDDRIGSLNSQRGTVDSDHAPELSFYKLRDGAKQSCNEGGLEEMHHEQALGKVLDVVEMLRRFVGA